MKGSQNTLPQDSHACLRLSLGQSHGQQYDYDRGEQLSDMGKPPSCWGSQRTRRPKQEAPMPQWQAATQAGHL